MHFKWKFVIICIKPSNYIGKYSSKWIEREKKCEFFLENWKKKIIFSQNFKWIEFFVDSNQILYFFIWIVNTVYGSFSITTGIPWLNDFIFPRYIFFLFFFLLPLLQSALDGNQMLLQFIAACSCDILILFMFCVGGEIIISANNISNDIYQLCWYNYNSWAKYNVWLMIARTQKPYRFADCTALNCCLATFTNVMILNIFSFVLFEKLISSIIADY